MRIGIVGYQGTGKSTVFELLTGVKPDPSKHHTGQVGVTVVPDERFDRLVEMYAPKKETPAKIELLDTPGISRGEQAGNAQRLGVIREATALAQVVGGFLGGNAVGEVEDFLTDLVLADLQVVTNRIERLKKDVTKPVPNRAELQQELDALLPIAARLEEGSTLHDMEFDDAQEKATRSFSLLSRKRQLVLLNTADSTIDADVIGRIEALGCPVVAGPFGLELEVNQLPEDERAIFAEEMGLGESSRARVIQAIFQLTDYITFYTCDEKEVHAWLLRRGSDAVEAAGAIHSDLARGFIRAEVMSTADLLRLGSEKEVKAAGLHRTEGKDYIVQDGDEIVIRFNV
ncbi:MAG: redox-regulated ATPase YchF [Planctomycetota bacterium]|nr:MAG: redox-regulated ATPase YchF [Planctomycetota bacterium]REK26914.1 MAG: redox-regulated ATPase YchF [Planctomycetota bacterium]REK35403.1 MAG: redox-regulated ATPase YchF [Planctomycetota bacterium]